MTKQFRTIGGVSGDFREALDNLVGKIKNDLPYVGAQAMAQVVYDSAKHNVRDSGIPTHWFYGTNSRKAPKGQKKQYAYLFHSGDLQKAIYQVFSKDSSTDTRKVYQVAWNHSNKNGSNSVPYGFMVEFGTKTRPAHPFLYPAYANNKAKLLDVAFAAMQQKLGFQ